MTTPKDIEALLSAVRALVAERTEAASDPLVLTDAHRIGSPRETATDEAASSPSGRDVLLRDFARLTLIAATEENEGATAVGDRAGSATTAQSELPLAAGVGHDVAALRTLVRDILRDELREDKGRHITDSILRVLQEELDRRADPAG